ncbi:hypothetical protein BSL78_25023 [Apostichopus japonicus]|uniref:Uncharacterized protein n=1 Tax=Stichopus japonicus TaxID=307972 RepID=A0A2G8JQZ6_STIJA|nr:hypothetical protein BSL78_25023 [Apostichopus japonicus]
MVNTKRCKGISRQGMERRKKETNRGRGEEILEVAKHLVDQPPPPPQHVPWKDIQLPKPGTPTKLMTVSRDNCSGRSLTNSSQWATGQEHQNVAGLEVLADQ